jgi:hypothetical protein
LQVAYYRPEPGRAPLEIDGQECPIPGEVVRHFPDMRGILRLNGPSSHVRIDLLGSAFAGDGRKAYLKGVCDTIGKFDGPPCIVFLDPDNCLGR